MKTSKLKILRNKYFISPESDSLKESISQLETSLTSVTKNSGKTPMYPQNIGIPTITKLINEAKIPQSLSKNPQKILKKLYQNIQGTVKSGHPFMVKNIIPTVSTPSLAAYYAASIYMGNAVTGEDAGQTLLSELSCASAISKLVGWDETKSGGIFTFGGTSTNLYAIKIGLHKVDPQHSENGITQPVACIESAPSHYCHTTATDWLGIGTNNLIQVNSNPDQTTKIDELEKACTQAIEDGKKIVCINALGGTTSNMGIDDIKKIYDIREKLINKFKLDYKPHIHVDAVLGWAYLVFSKYDFKSNPLNFSANVIKRIKKITKRIKTLKYADSFGVDFHKTGFVAYNSSIVMVKNKDDFKLLRRNNDVMTPLFHDESAYNPGKYTLETSRSSANILATWIALQTFGLEGYQILLGNALEMSFIYRNEIAKNKRFGLFIANQDAFGPDVFIRCYPPKSDVENIYNKEMNNNSLLEKYNEYTTKFANWIENEGYPHKEDGFAISRSSAAIYTNTGKPMIALRIYPLSPYIESKDAKELIKRIITAKQKFDSKQIN